MKFALLTALTLVSLAIVAPAYAAGDAAAGKAKSGPCAMCHGPTGAGTAVGPKLDGKSPADFVQALKDFQSGKRVNAMMKTQASQLSETDMANLAAYYSAIK
jgi:cytochrome c553